MKFIASGHISICFFKLKVTKKYTKMQTFSFMSQDQQNMCYMAATIAQQITNNISLLLYMCMLHISALKALPLTIGLKYTFE